MRRKVLVIEDHPDSREMLELVLKDNGYTVIAAEDGLSGLNIAKAVRPDVIITNINMPNLDGMEMIKQVRQIPELQQVPIVVLSAVRTDDPEALIKKRFLETLTEALQGIAKQGQAEG